MPDLKNGASESIWGARYAIMALPPQSPSSTGRPLAVCTALRLAVLAAMVCSAPAAAQAQPSPATTRVAAAPPTAASPGAAEDDALLELRQRLVERLSGSPHTPRNSTDLTLSPRPPAARAQSQRPSATAAAAAPASSPRPSAKPAARPAVDASAAPAAPAAAWSYDGATGPAAWGTLRPEYALCAQGQRQSPIDLHGGLPVDLEPVRFDYRPSRFGVLDTGRTLQVGVASGNHIDFGGRRFELRRVRFHHPAEHQIDGRRFALSAHLEHEDAEGRQVVVAVLFDPGPVQPVLQALWSHIPLEPQQEQAARINVDFAGLLPADRRYYTYMGSATTPPCREGVQWVVMRNPVTLAPEQLEVFARLYPMNARPLQAAAGRRILQSE